ncbi:MAG: ATP-binding protein, partial [Candidatus Riflebacteria bacterium]|nr:ATP-binding protein [Candidatus Riflebacteria bacterium]
MQSVLARLGEPRRFLQVLTGPRQVGKTTLARQVEGRCRLPVVFASADGPLLEDHGWLEAQWQRGRLEARGARGAQGAILILDEIQKVRGWSETVKRRWDEDTARGVPLRVLILGSSVLLVERGLAESLAGRFEVLRATHWGLAEMKAAFGVGPDEFVYFGGYPGAWPLVREPDRWRSYVLESLVETTLSRDILLLRPVDKPPLLRRLFHLGCAFSGEVLSYQKMLGQLQDVGNTTTLAHYLHLLEGAGLVAGLPKFRPGPNRLRASSPKLQVLNLALATAVSGPDFDAARRDHALAYDSTRGACILFSGQWTGMVNDTWNWNGLSWDRLMPGTSPSTRSGHRMAHDAKRGRTVLFGGTLSETSGPFFGDTWE